MSNGKDIIILLIAELMKRIYYKLSQYFPPYRSRGGDIKVELKTNLASLKT